MRAHFGCESLEGAELENQGAGGVAGRHWENRVFGVSVPSIVGNGACTVN